MDYIYRFRFYLLAAVAIPLLFAGCTTQKSLTYLGNLPELGGEETFTMQIPDYTISGGDLLYITARAMGPDGQITDFLSPMRSNMSTGYLQGEAGQYIYGYDVRKNGEVMLPGVGGVSVEGLTLEEARHKIQDRVDRVFSNAMVECKLISFRFSVLGEVRAPGSYVNYKNHLTILEAIAKAGGISDFGRRDRIVVVRPFDGGTRTFTLDLQDKATLASEAYFLLPNDVVIVEPQTRKPFNLNLPTYSFIMSSVTAAVTTTLLLINYFR